LNDDEKQKYDQTKQNQDVIDDFVNQNNNVTKDQKIPLTDEAIKVIGNDKELTFENINFD
jgi:hypothetical protein